MAVIYIIAAIFAGSEYIEKEISSGTSGPSLCFTISKGQLQQGYLLFSSVRFILGEIVPAFKVFQTSCTNSKPALDCPIVYTYTPNTVLIGFILH